MDKILVSVSILFKCYSITHILVFIVLFSFTVCVLSTLVLYVLAVGKHPNTINQDSIFLWKK